MSNPSVFELNKSNIKDNIFLIEDNIGESIHFHVGLVRFDLSVKEFDDITLKLIDVLNEQVGLDNFDLTKQNEYFLERIASVIPYITSVEDVTVNVEDLKYRFETQNGNIEENYIVNTPIYKYYMGCHEIIDEYAFDLEIWQSKEELMEQVKKTRNDFIYVDENNFILDGYKSICAGLALSDIENVIRVKRINVLDGIEVKCMLLREKRKW